MVNVFPLKDRSSGQLTAFDRGFALLAAYFACSDEKLLATWIENPYWQHFCGETYFQHQLPIDSSSLTRWRQRIGEEGVEWLLTETIEAARRGKVVKEKSFDKIIVDTTVMEKAIAYPTDSRLFERARQHLVKLAGLLGIKLRQNYNRQAPYLTLKIGRYAHARQLAHESRAQSLAYASWSRLARH